MYSILQSLVIVHSCSEKHILIYLLDVPKSKNKLWYKRQEPIQE